MHFKRLPEPTYAMLDRRLILFRNWLPLLALTAVQVTTKPMFNPGHQSSALPSLLNDDDLPFWQPATTLQQKGLHLPPTPDAELATLQDAPDFHSPLHEALNGPATPWHSYARPQDASSSAHTQSLQAAPDFHSRFQGAWTAPATSWHSNTIPPGWTGSTAEQPRLPDQPTMLETASLGAGTSIGAPILQGLSERALEARSRRRSAMFASDAEMQRAWEQKLRFALGRQDLQVKPPDLHSTENTRIFLAQGDDTVLDLPSVAPGAEEAGSEATRRTMSWILQSVQNLQRINPKKYPPLPVNKRFYTYFNSPRHLAELNDNYFLGHLRFVPIKADELKRTELTTLFWDRKVQYLLPPLTEHGLPSLVLYHGERTGNRKWYFSKFIGRADKKGFISLWSPVLTYDKKYMMVLYGIGQLTDSSKGDQIRNHLESLAERASSLSYSPIYHLDNFHP